MNPVSVDTKFVVDRARHVTVNPAACRAVVKDFNAAAYSTFDWSKHALNPKVGLTHTAEEAVKWIFTVDLLNFSFWSEVDDQDTGKAETQRYAVEYKGEQYTGYWALAAAINRALDGGVQITDSHTWTRSDFDSVLEQIFASSTTEKVPLLKERAAVLREAGQADQTIFDLIKKAKGSALELVSLLTNTYASFDDSSEYDGRKISINKRAQIFVADIWACFNGNSYGSFYDIDKLTMFADYRVPQILHQLGCISYSQELENTVRQKYMIPHGAEMEVELRAASIQAVEEMISYIKSIEENPQANSVLIDFYLWDTAKEKQKKGELDDAIPCHRTRSIYY